MIRPFAFFLALVMSLSAEPRQGTAAAEEPRQFTIGYLSIEDDPRHAERRSYARIVLRPAIDPFQGAVTALKEGKILGRAAKVRFALERAAELGCGYVFACTTSERVIGFFKRQDFHTVPADRVPEAKWSSYDPARRPHVRCLRRELGTGNSRT